MPVLQFGNPNQLNEMPLTLPATFLPLAVYPSMPLDLPETGLRWSHYQAERCC